VKINDSTTFDTNSAAPPGEQCAPQCDPTHRCCWLVPVYRAETRFRGNVTKITVFADATIPTGSVDPNAVVTTVKYDIAGNVTETTSSCCDLKTTQYVVGNHYAYPVSETRSGSGGLSMTTSATYDLNTGAMKTATDENNQTTTVTYNASNMRVTQVDGPDGSQAMTEHNDSTFPYYVKSTVKLDSTRSVSSWRFTNGRGQNFMSRSQTGTDAYLSSDVDFDSMGRAVKSYNPYTVSTLTAARPSSGIPFTQITSRDGLGRTLQTTLPDSTTVSASYSGLVATVTDQAGKSRRQLADALGRIIRVDEPDSGGILGDVGAPNQPTYYEYDGNDNLTKVTQTDTSVTPNVTQERLFKYDSLSRLTHERQVEASPTLDNDGVKQTSGGLWTGVYKYNTDNLLIEGFDARGVKTAFTYDGLNRVTSVVYTGETGYQTPTVTYTYDEAESTFHNVGRLTKVRTELNTSQGTPETIHNFRYDKTGQVVKQTTSIGSESYLQEYGYNLAGQLTSQKYPSGKVVTMTVDNFGRLQTVADDQRSYLSGVSFNDRGLLSQINLGNGNHETFIYNDRFQMTSQSLMKSSTVLQKWDYGYGEINGSGALDTTKNNGQLGRIEGFIGSSKQWSQRFGYDELGRLSEAREYKQGDNAQLTYKQKFDFDRFGNLYRKASSNPTAGQQNPLPFTPIEEADISKSTNRFTTGTTYDDAGQVVSDAKFRSMSFGYDANGRQVKATRTRVPDAWTVYDALGNRVATKINDVWQYVVYDAFGKLIAEYGVASEGLGGLKYIQQDWQGSVRTVTNNNGFVVSRTDHQPFGEEIGSGTGLRSIEQGYNRDPSTRQGYGLTERDDATGLDHTWFRKNENQAGRWTSPDPYKGSMSLGNPQSFNRYSYVVNDPINFVDPDGLYEACVHEAMTRFLGNLAGEDPNLVNRLALYTGDRDERNSADADRWAATSARNINEWLMLGTGPWKTHFPTEAELRYRMGRYSSDISQGSVVYAAHTLHSIQDGLGAHAGIRRLPGHAGSNAAERLGVGTSVDRILGDQKFIRAALATLHTISNGRMSTLTPNQVNQLIDAIIRECGGRFEFQITRPQETIFGGGGGGYEPGFYPYHYIWYPTTIWIIIIRIEVVTVTEGDEEPCPPSGCY